MNANVAPFVPAIWEGEVRNGKVSFAGKLDPSELLTGTPTVTELVTSDLTLSSVAVNTAQLTINGLTVPIGEAVQFAISGQLASGQEYTLRVECDTDSTPPQTLRGKIRFRVLDPT